MICMIRQFPQFMFSLFLLCLGAGLLIYTYLFPGAEGSVSVTYGPMFYPRVLLWLWVLLALASLAESLLKSGKALAPQYWRGVGAAVCLTMVAAFLLTRVGFLPVSFIFVAAYAWILGYRRPAVLLAASLGYAVSVWFVFNKVLEVSLPEIPFM